MERPPARLLQKRLKCAVGVEEADAFEACEDACGLSGFTVASRAEHSWVLLPSATPSWIRCLAPGHTQSPSQEPSAGRGITVEFTSRGAEGGRLLVSISAAKTRKSKDFLSELRSRLKVAAQRAKLAGVGAGQQPQAERGTDHHKERADSLLCSAAAYYYVSRLNA
mmetsp:Transcript_40138/g.93236  ORF Transcript_40138/g.93236 Transcript_40138/m.93236 type:complete len:166 (-) Transcript_40138:281-778(-)